MLSLQKEKKEGHKAGGGEGEEEEGEVEGRHRCSSTKCLIAHKNAATIKIIHNAIYINLVSFSFSSFRFHFIPISLFISAFRCHFVTFINWNVMWLRI